MDERQQIQTPFSPCSFDFYPGSPEANNHEGQGIRQVFRFAGAPDGPLPSIPSDESDSELEDFVVMRRVPEATRSKFANYPKKEEKKKTWRDFPFVCLLATILCTVGGIMYAVAIHKVTDLILVTLQEVMHISYEWLETAQILGTASGCLIAALSLAVFLASCISTYHLSTTSATPQMVFITLIYPGLFVWGLFLATSIGATFVSSVIQGLCNTNEISSIWTHWNSTDGNTVCATIMEQQKCVNCIDLYPYHFIFPLKARKEDMWICGRELVLLCHQNMPQIQSRWIMCFIGSLMALLGIATHLPDLSYLRTQIKETDKLKTNRELRYIRSHVKSALYNSRPNSTATAGLSFLKKTENM